MEIKKLKETVDLKDKYLEGKIKELKLVDANYEGTINELAKGAMIITKLETSIAVKNKQLENLNNEHEI